MVFNSVVFLFCFLPLSLLLYYLVPGRAKNAVLLAESLLFYCWTGVAFLPLIAILIAFNLSVGPADGPGQNNAARAAAAGGGAGQPWGAGVF